MTRFEGPNSKTSPSRGDRLVGGTEATSVEKKIRPGQRQVDGGKPFAQGRCLRPRGHRQVSGLHRGIKAG